MQRLENCMFSLKPYIGVIFIGLFVTAIGWTQILDISEPILVWAEKSFGDLGRRRLVEWQNLINSNRQIDELNKLSTVNDFINQLSDVQDLAHWGREDYWATPLETLASGGGDCEDLAIAKYFLLKKLGIDDTKLKLTYVKTLTLNQSHMVLSYFSTPDAVPLVLDTLTPEIKSATDREDLLPVYAFNGTNLWLAGQRRAGKRIGDAGKLPLWQDLLERIGKESYQF